MISKDFYYTLGRPQPKRVRLMHSWEGVRIVNMSYIYSDIVPLSTKTLLSHVI